MDKDQIVENFLSEIKREFPDVGLLIEQREIDMEIEPEDRMYTDLFECFSQVTTDAIKIKDSDTASKHLIYMSKKLNDASEVEREYIDTYYTESLMWDIKDQKLKSWGWKLFPENLKTLYENMWGKQKF